MNYKRFLELFWEFNNFIVTLHTLYLDTIAGFKILHHQVKNYQNKIKSFLGDCEEAGEEFQDKCSIDYKMLCEEDFNVVSMWPTMKQGEVKKRTAKNGTNYILMARQCVVSAYTYWEVYLRKEIGIALGIIEPKIKDKEEIQRILNKYVKSDFWGDMKRLRHAILHKNGIADSDISKCKILKWFEPGQPIDLDFDKMRFIFLQMGHYRNYIHSLSLPPRKLTIGG
jgi:hypothetical protein